MQVVFPGSSESNPYQRLLGGALEEEQVTVRHYKCFSLLRILADGRPDVVHFHWPERFFLTGNIFTTFVLSIFFLLRLVFLKALGVRLAWTAHNIEPHFGCHPRLVKSVFSYFSGMCDAVFAHTLSSKKLVQKTYGLDPLRVHVAEHGSYLGFYTDSVSGQDARHALGLTESEMVYLFFGFIREYKGVRELFGSFSGVGGKGWRLLVAGSAQDSDTNDEILESAGSDERIMLNLSYIPDDEVQLYFNAADVVVFPYRDALTSGALVLAMSFGKPVIASRVGCVEEFVDEGGAFFFDAGDIDGLGGCLVDASENRHDLKRMGDVNLERAKALDWGRAAKTIKKHYLGGVRG